MVGNTWRMDKPNRVDISPDAYVCVDWREALGKWKLELVFAGRHGWATVLTGHFKSIDKLDELVASARELMDVED